MNFITVVKDFMRNMVVFTVLSAFCVHLLPEQKYQKYARFAIGLVYICMVLELLGTILGKSITVMTF
ncbi:MAG: stage III sporulation protein AF [Lachnospiraceae bacterium]|nr:stage III sporulation protein AF [Lachnospiraceae bacterium]MBP3506455.1 stage III sporulation protein AF [Lachnospiraceae bacterium]